ncbi:hypothetical protein [uncultured Rikenella sp.]|uniref:hypothetical protein n=1 Tax=uncultured Rikenella sp. TaxID=368003 RepID=UPI00262CBCA0|nr:hypothetical protein [uncultured Rikenella sp.]
MKLLNALTQLPNDIEHVYIINHDTALQVKIAITPENRKDILSEYAHATVEHKFFNNDNSTCIFYVNAGADLIDIVNMIKSCKLYLTVSKIRLLTRANDLIGYLHWYDDFEPGDFTHWRVLSRRFVLDECIVRIERRKYVEAERR